MTQYEMDLVGAGLCLANAFVLCGINSLTSPNREAGHWLPAPRLVRLAMWPVILTFAAVGAERWMIAGDLSQVGGHSSWFMIGANVALLVLFGAVQITILKMTYPVRVWDRFRAMAKIVECKPRAVETGELIPAMLTKQEVTAAVASQSPSPTIGPVPGGWDEAEAPHHPKAVVRVH